jgi:hypothetical protein
MCCVRFVHTLLSLAMGCVPLGGHEDVGGAADGLPRIIVVQSQAWNGARLSPRGPAYPASLKQGPLVEVAVFGWEGLSDSTRRLSAAERRSMGGVLAKPVAVSEAKDGALYVLDSEFRKIVVFNRNGTLRRVILGGPGEGPGEFVRPRDMTLTDRGHVVVIDEALSRITVFDTSGTLIRSRAAQLTSPYKLVASGDELYALSWYRGDEMAIAVLDTLGAVSKRILRPSKRDYEFATGGEAGQLGKSLSGEVIFAHPTVGRLTMLPSGRTSGKELVPEMYAGVWTDQDGRTKYTTAGPRGIGQLVDGSFLIYYGAFNMPAMRQRRIEMDYFLARLVDDSSSFVIPAPHARRGAFTVARSGSEFFLSREDPFPQVVRYRIQVR